jgi:hypothetical protein
VRFLLVVPILVLADAVIAARTGMTMTAFELSG